LVPQLKVAGWGSITVPFIDLKDCIISVIKLLNRGDYFYFPAETVLGLTERYDQAERKLPVLFEFVDIKDRRSLLKRP
jgi:hypothetical protein